MWTQDSAGGHCGPVDVIGLCPIGVMPRGRGGQTGREMLSVVGGFRVCPAHFGGVEYTQRGGLC